MQSVVVAFLLLHDWVPLGRFNNVAAMRGEDSVAHRILVTLLPFIPTAAGLYYGITYFGQPYPHWLEMLLWITYGVLMVGLLRAWWVPYLVIQDPVRAARYRIIFAGHVQIFAGAEWHGSRRPAYVVSSGGCGYFDRAVFSGSFIGAGSSLTSPYAESEAEGWHFSPSQPTLLLRMNCHPWFCISATKLRSRYNQPQQER